MAPGKILVLAPHTDDGELGCGATIARFVEVGADVTYLAFSWLPEFQDGTLAAECRESAQVLGMTEWLMNYPVRRYHEFRQDILDVLVKINKEHEFKIVFAPSKFDVHQDHEVIYQEALRAFKHTIILGYEAPWNNYSFEHNFFITVSESNIEKKIGAIKKYKSQSHKPYMAPEYIRALAKTRGIQIKMEYAEAFHLIRGIL